MFRCQVDESTYLTLNEMRFVERFHRVIEENRDHIGQYLTFAATQTFDQTQTFVQASLAKYASGSDVPCLIWHRGEIAGSIGLHLGPSRKNTAIGYWMAAKFTGQGIMTRCCRTVIDYAFEGLGLHRVEIRAVTSNEKSRAIPQRLGFKLEGVIREDVWLYDRFVDSAVYGLLAEEWASREMAATSPTSAP